jgi:hypothetical protein
LGTKWECGSGSENEWGVVFLFWYENHWDYKKVGLLGEKREIEIYRILHYEIMKIQVMD